MPDTETEEAAMPVPRAPDPLAAVRALAARRFFGIGAGVAAASAAVFTILPFDLPEGRRPFLVAVYLVYAGLALLAGRLGLARIGFVTGLMAIAATVAVSGGVVLAGFGVEAPALGFLGLISLLTVAVSPMVVATGVALLSAALTALIAWADWQGLLRTAATPAGDVLLLHLLLQWLLIGGGLAGGALLSRLVARHVLAAEEREQRFRGLLAVAADAYWELDSGYRLVALSYPSRRGGAPRTADATLLGRVPWDQPRLAIDPDTQDLLQANLEARAPFRGLPMQWVTTAGDMVHVVVSGEPRVNARGIFRGYWGVARDVSADVSARHALAATEERYQDLFEHIPTPLLLHRGGRIVDANPAAQALLAPDVAASMAGLDFASFFEGGDSRERARRRLEEIETLPLGKALPVTDYRLVSRTGRRISVRATAVRVAAPGGSATLSILLDDTERRAAEDAVRRSETMLSNLVATIPDAIALTDLTTGRYAMVNQTFERVTGFAAADIVGRTSMEIGIWVHPQDRADFVAGLKRDGTVRDMPAHLRTKSGEHLLVRVSGARFMMDRREYMVTNTRDMTASERERLEREAILDTASIGIALTRADRFVLVNPRLERLCGWPRGALAGEPAHVLWGSEVEYRKTGGDIGLRLARGEVADIEMRVFRRDGTTFTGRVTANPIDPMKPTDGGTVWIVEDVTAQRQAEASLARARDEAEAANRAKSAFLANTSHELRTPLNAMIGLARLAREPSLDDKRRSQYLDQIGDSAQSLSAIISDILDLSKIESGKLTLEAAPFELGALLRTLHLGYTLLADARGLTLTLDIGPGTEGAVSGDALRVRQILNNFLSNALKFTETGTVRIVVRRIDAKLVRFEVQDTGQGIDATTQSRLFRPFTQADESTTRRFGGTGLGLSICRELAELMGGQVGVQSTPGLGSRFWALLPLPAASPLAVSGPALPQRLDGTRVLMVEDNPVNMMIAVAMLERWGVSVEQAVDGAQAVAAIERAAVQRHPMDAVLMDVQMPVMSGYEATRILRRTFDAQTLPIIALTAAALVTEREQAIACGMNDFLTKPIDPDRLLATLARWTTERTPSRA